MVCPARGRLGRIQSPASLGLRVRGVVGASTDQAERAGSGMAGEGLRLSGAAGLHAIHAIQRQCHSRQHPTRDDDHEGEVPSRQTTRGGCPSERRAVASPVCRVSGLSSGGLP
jgi:hypothetical protein